MIDEIKIKRELQNLVDKSAEGTLDNKLYNSFLEYISRQPVINPARTQFEQRIGAVLIAMGKMNVVERNG